MNILAIGGGRIYAGETATIDRYASSLLPTDKKNIAILPTASHDRLDYIVAVQKAYAELGISSRVIFEKDIETKESVEILKYAGGLYIGAGDVKHLLKKLTPSFVATLNEFARDDKLIIGLSAGCAVLFERAIFYEDKKANVVEGLGIIVGGVLPHYNENLLEACKDDIELALHKDISLYGISDGSTLHFTDINKFNVVMEPYSKGTWKISEKSGSLRAEQI